MKLPARSVLLQGESLELTQSNTSRKFFKTFVPNPLGLFANSINI